ncbi:hypothetical protein Bca4012_093078 [Brassica carinata]
MKAMGSATQRSPCEPRRSREVRRGRRPSPANLDSPCIPSVDLTGTTRCGFHHFHKGIRSEKKPPPPAVLEQMLRKRHQIWNPASESIFRSTTAPSVSSPRTAGEEKEFPG